MGWNSRKHRTRAHTLRRSCVLEELEARKLMSTTLLKDINPTGASNASNFVVAGNKLFFSANDGTHGAELWMTDGSPGGTKMVKDINPGSAASAPTDLTA